MRSTDRLHTYSTNSEIVLERIRHLPIGGRMKDIPSHLWHDSYVRVGEKKTGGPNLRLLRLDPKLPANTITAYIFNKFVHPIEHRYITPREAARLQQFPDDHQFAGTVTDIQLQIGNAVPVGLARAVAGMVANRLREAEPRRKLSAVSLFAGAGGMDLGFKDFFKVNAANEYIRTFSETLTLNFPKTAIINEDLAHIEGRDMFPKGTPDLVFGGPPCQPFSAAGKQRGVNDPRGQLVREYLRIVSELEPPYFVMENVPGLISNAGGGALKFIQTVADSIGYATEAMVLTATDYGVPQRRNRLFVIGRRNALERPFGPPPPTHTRSPIEQIDLLGLLPCATVGEAFEGLPEAEPRGFSTARSGF
jgi:DNA (cytosine-5)-methyltransferase 1